MISLPDLAERLQHLGLINKSFMECTREEIEKLVGAVFSCPDMQEVPAGGWVMPILYETEDGRRGISIPYAAHPKYRWWTPTGQSLEQTLLELQAPYDIAKQYVLHTTEEEWNQKLIPFEV